MSHQLGGPMCPASFSVTWEATSTSSVSLCTIFSLWWLNIQIFPFFPVERE